MKLTIVATLLLGLAFRSAAGALSGPQAVALHKAARNVVTGPAVSTMVRLAFHDCAVKCDGCIDVNNPDNAGLKPLVDALDASYQLYNISTFMSRADFWSYAALAAINMTVENANVAAGCNSTNPFCAVPSLGLVFKRGRTDCSTAPYGTGDILPSANLDNTGVMNYFAKAFGFNTAETVALMGVHIFGQANANASGFSGRWWLTAPNSMSNKFYQILRNNSMGWTQRNVSPAGTTPHYQWNGIYSPPGFMLNSDMALYKNVTVDATGYASCGQISCLVSAPSAAIVDTYASNQTKWLSDFAGVFDKMLTHGNTNLVPEYNVLLQSTTTG